MEGRRAANANVIVKRLELHIFDEKEVSKSGRAWCGYDPLLSLQQYIGIHMSYINQFITCVCEVHIKSSCTIQTYSYLLYPKVFSKHALLPNRIHRLADWQIH